MKTYALITLMTLSVVAAACNEILHNDGFSTGAQKMRADAGTRDGGVAGAGGRDGGGSAGSDGGRSVPAGGGDASMSSNVPAVGCAASSECTPGETTACAQGECKNNTTGPSTCPKCGQRVCQPDCRWSDCKSIVDAPNACLDDHWTCCGPGKWRWCNTNNMVCQYNDCAACNGDSDCTGECK